MENLESVIKKYVEKMKKDYNVVGAMLTGSYITGKMKPNSDIDIFFIWDRENKSMRGREFYNNIEFEYFVSPEWKYYDRLKSDLISQQIYSSGKIIFDSNDTFKNIQQKAIEYSRNYNPELSASEKVDYSFYVETIMKDGIDMLVDGELEGFYFLSGMHIPKFCNIIAKIKKKYPIYEKHAIEQLNLLDKELFHEIVEFYKSNDKNDIYNKWIDLCKYVLNELGEIDLKNYQVISNLERP